MKTVVSFFISLFLLTGCNSIGQSQESKKQSYIKEFERLVLVVENREVISEKEWSVEFDPKFKLLNEVEYQKLEAAFTEIEFGIIKDLRDRYRSRRLKSKAANSIKDAVRGTKDFIRELTH